jgi:hypothetical protein
MNNEQCRVARAMLGWSARELSRQSQVGERTILEFEANARRIMPQTNGKIRSLFVVNGIEFIDDENGIGIRRRFTIEEYIARQELHESRGAQPEPTRQPALDPAQ